MTLSHPTQPDLFAGDLTFSVDDSKQVEDVEDDDSFEFEEVQYDHGNSSGEFTL